MSQDGRNQPPRSRGIEEAIGLFDVGVELLRGRLRRRHPDASDAEIEERISEWLHEIPPSNSLRPSEKWTKRLRATD